MPTDSNIDAEAKRYAKSIRDRSLSAADEVVITYAYRAGWAAHERLLAERDVHESDTKPEPYHDIQAIRDRINREARPFA